MKPTLHLLLRIVPLGLVAALTACGGGGGSTTPSTTPPTTPPTTLGPATRTVLDVRGFQVRRGAGIFYNFDNLPEGTFDTTMDWNNGDIPVSIFVTDANACPSIQSLTDGGCRVYASSRDKAVKPKSLTVPVAAGKPSYAVWVLNEGTVTTEGTVETGITSREKPTTPAPTNPDDPQAGLADGPVASAFIKVRSIDTGNFRYRDAFQDREGYWVLYKGEFVVFDLTQKNAGGAPCKWRSNPTWDVDDPSGVLSLRGSSNPFLLRLDVTADSGLVDITSTIDGVTSNVLKIKVTTNR